MNEITVTKYNFNDVMESDVPVLLDFWAVWCGPCRMVAPELEKVANQLEGKVKVGKINVDEEMEIAQEFGIEVIPTLVLIKNGQEKLRFSGYLTSDEIIAKFNLK